MKRTRLNDLPAAFKDAVQDSASNAPVSSDHRDVPSNSTGANTIYGDLSLIVKNFGKFKPFLRFGGKAIDAEMFISTLERHCTNTYGSVDGIIEHFYVFLGEELYSWYFDLAGSQKSNWTEFKKSFVDKANDLEYDLFDLTALKKTEFLAKIKSNKPDDSKLAENIRTRPISTYFSEKLKVLSLVYPNMSSEDLVWNALAHLGDKNLFKKLSKYRKDPDALAFITKLEDKKV